MIPENDQTEISENDEGFSVHNGMDELHIDTSSLTSLSISCDCTLDWYGQGITIPAHRVPELLDMLNKHLSKYSEANNV